MTRINNIKKIRSDLLCKYYKRGHTPKIFYNCETKYYIWVCECTEYGSWLEDVKSVVVEYEQIHILSLENNNSND